MNQTEIKKALFVAVIALVSVAVVYRLGTANPVRKLVTNGQ